MKVVHIITGLSNGGAEAVLYRLCTHDEANQHVVISLMDAGKYGPLLERGGVRSFYLNMPRGRVTPGGLVRLWRTIRQERPDVVQTWMYHADLLGGLVARMAGVRQVFWGIRHSTLKPGESSRSAIAIARLCAWLSRYVPKGIVCCAERAREVHVALGYASSKCHVIPNGYDLGRLQPDDAAGQHLREQWGASMSVPLIGMVARFNAQKDHANLLAGLAGLKRRGREFRCVLVGPEMTSDNTTLATWINQHSLQQEVRLLGPRSDIPAVMSALDLHILPSAFGEGFPNVVAEAMACGTPCVVTDVGDASLIVGEAGWVVAPRDSRALADAIDWALREYREEPVAWRMRQTSCQRRIVENFSLPSMVAAYERLWRTELPSNKCKGDTKRLRQTSR